MMLAVTDPPQDFLGFLIWALVAVCVVLGALAGGAIRYSIGKLEQKEVECKAERKEDQQLFLSALASRDTRNIAMEDLVKKTNELLMEHHKSMTEKHEIEAETIARLAGEAAVKNYIAAHPAH